MAITMGRYTYQFTLELSEGRQVDVGGLLDVEIGPDGKWTVRDLERKHIGRAELLVDAVLDYLASRVGGKDPRAAKGG